MAHARIERAFLEGGEVLVSVIEILNGLTGVLDGMTGTLDGNTAEHAISGLRKTTDELALLPQAAQAREAHFDELAALCLTTGSHIEDIHETIRYLKTFAVTVKITGAGLSDFGEFANEIQARIQSGADEVTKFAGLLSTMRQQLQNARSFSSKAQHDYDQTIPQIISSLNENSLRIVRQHKEMADIANDVKIIAMGIQGKIGSVLSALQIGDITRQRLEHVQSMLLIHDEYSRTEEAISLGRHALGDLSQGVYHLASAQMRDTTSDFQRESRKILSSISSFAEDAGKILALRDELMAKSSNSEDNALAVMERDIANACKLVARIQGINSDAAAVVCSVTQNAQDLLQGIELLRSIKIDIHYMALNSNLRCSKLGEEGKPVNVVSGELRTFAAKLETPADAIVLNLQKVEHAIGGLIGESDGASEDLARPLEVALGSIQTARSQMDDGLRALGNEGQVVYSRISAMVVKLDFENELGDALQDCCSIVSDLAGDVQVDLSAIRENILPMATSIYKLYTMAQERDIHVRFLPAVHRENVQSITASADLFDEADDEDLFADALF